jgi:hypothetical protein
VVVAAAVIRQFRPQAEQVAAVQVQQVTQTRQTEQ